MGRTAEEILQETVNKPIPYIEEDWRSVSDDALLLVRGMLAKNPTDRFSMKEVMSFSWVTHPPLCENKNNPKRFFVIRSTVILCFKCTNDAPRKWDASVVLSCL